MGKNILFICYWGLDDVLTQSTVWPRLKVLEEADWVNKIVLVTMERHGQTLQSAGLVNAKKIKHVPYYTGVSYFQKISDFIDLPFKLVRVSQLEQVDVIFAHGAPAGALAYKVWKKLKIPFYVSSFEPHADYMVESGVWNRYGLKYIFQKYWEEQQIREATGLMPVSDNYTSCLVSKGVEATKVKTVPSIVHTDEFRFEPESRYKIRAELNWQTATVGVYVGKFGGLYYNNEAFKIYSYCFDLIENFRLLILSPQPEEVIIAQLQRYSIDLDKVLVTSVPHSQVPKFLSAADFAFATLKPGPSKKYLSPVKVGEYWANGLPVLLTEGVGDESDIIKREGGGALINLQEKVNVEKAILQIKAILADPTHRQEIPKLATKYRSPDKIREAYEYFFNQLPQNKA